MIISSLVKTGCGKEICDDSVFDGCCVINNTDFSSNSQNSEWIAVADGVGGYAGGNEASRFILEYIQDNYVFISEVNTLFSLLHDANGEMIKYATSIDGKENMATTFTGLFFGDEDVKIAHVGNARVYALQGNYLKQITRDHTTYQWLMMQGNFEAAGACNKSEITSCFGGGDVSLLKGLSIDTLLLEELPKVLVLTTDGIHDYLDIDTLEAIITEPISIEERMKKIWKAAKENGSCDDCSIIIIEEAGKNYKERIITSF